MKKVEQSQVKNPQLESDMQLVSQRGLFPCRFVGMHFIHNFLMLVREGLLDKNALILLDIRRSNPTAFNALHIMKSQIFSIPNW